MKTETSKPHPIKPEHIERYRGFVIAVSNLVSKEELTAVSTQRLTTEHGVANCTMQVMVDQGILAKGSSTGGNGNLYRWIGGEHVTNNKHITKLIEAVRKIQRDQKEISRNKTKGATPEVKNEVVAILTGHSEKSNTKVARAKKNQPEAAKPVEPKHQGILYSMEQLAYIGSQFFTIPQHIEVNNMFELHDVEKITYELKDTVLHICFFTNVLGDAKEGLECRATVKFKLRIIEMGKRDNDKAFKMYSHPINVEEPANAKKN